MVFRTRQKNVNCMEHLLQFRVQLESSGYFNLVLSWNIFTPARLVSYK